MKTAEAYSAPLPPLWQQMAAADVPLALWVKQHVPAAVHHGDWGVRHGPPDALGNCLPAAIPQYGCSGTFGDAAGLYQAPAGLCGEGCWAQSVAGLAGYVGAVVRWAGPISPLPLIGATKAPWARGTTELVQGLRGLLAGLPRDLGQTSGLQVQPDDGTDTMPRPGLLAEPPMAAQARERVLLLLESWCSCCWAVLVTILDHSQKMGPCCCRRSSGGGQCPLPLGMGQPGAPGRGR